MPDLARLEVVEQVVSCTDCELHAQCAGPVAFRGQPGALVVVVGEAPGEQEDTQGAPFVGPAGQKMTELLTDVGFDVETQVAFVNTVSCWPHDTPDWSHVEACSSNKAAQLEYLNARWVLVVGKVALKGTRRDLDLKHGRCRPFLHEDRIHFVTYHPAAALREGHYEQAMTEDLAVFAEMVANEATSRWQDFIPLSCAGCANPAVFWDEPSELGWCENHSASARKHMERVRADREAARGRLG